MFLKSIEIQGFKSFAHKTVLNFNQGMTAIVGPNGSGKSNIADAVRWVLGEQKVKQLRGASMQDVIFAGTELRKPLGFAFVSMTFDNSDHALNLDYSEVTVSRRLFRSGESEYMINGQSVRLKDVQELFFDTGIGKEGYSIIGQGQIEAIVSGRPEDRRGLFDEACGIVKFKKRKQAAVKKLEEEEINLNRVSDILSELEKRVGPLEKQAINAKEYLRLHDILKKYDLTIFVQEAGSILDELEENEKDNQILNDQISALRQEASSLKAHNQELSVQIQEVEDSIDSLKQDTQKGLLLINNLESQISVASVEIGSETANISRYHEAVDKLNQQRKDKESVLLSYLRSVGELKNDINVLTSQTGTTGAELDLDPSALIAELNHSEEKLRDLIDPEALDSFMNRDDRSTASQSPEEKDEFEFEEPDWLKSIISKKDDLHIINEKAEQLESWLRAAQTQSDTITSSIQKAEEKLKEHSLNRSALQSKLDTLKNIAERYEGYGQAVQSVMRLKDRDEGIKGVIADLIRTENRYETAIETALGARIQNIVTDSETTAKKLIQYLKSNHAGRATFLPQDAVKPKFQEDIKRALNESGCLGTASELVLFDPEYQNIVESLLGNTLVFQSVDQALTAADKFSHSLRIVTLDGELLSPGGAISGGAYKNSSNLIGRSRELKELEDKIVDLDRLISESEDRLNELKTRLNSSDSEVERLRNALQDVNEEKNSLSFGLTSDMKLKLSNIKQSADFMNENIGRVLTETDRETEEFSRLQSLLTESSDLIKNKENEIALRKEDIIHIKQGMSDAQIKLAEVQQKKDELMKGQSEYYQRKDELNEETLHLEKELMRLDNQKEKLSGKLDAQTQRIWDEYSITLTQAKQEADNSLGSISSMKSEISRLQTRIKALGPINIQAIEEYKEVAERYELMKVQHDDIVHAREEIIKIIKELDEGMKTQFNVQFANIRTEFLKVFQELFGGGSADLELVYDEESDQVQDELNAGIAIKAQPPGKKLQNMMQLSGGEKAFTAIALLFAIQNLKPSPFCLLDEIEAALDDSNVLRFAQYIRRICDRSQFILITHRRGTMENADRLYGITMQEKGVTSLVSVDLVSEELS